MNDRTDDAKPARKSAAKPELGSGEVRVPEVTRGTADSDSVRRVQHALTKMDGLPKDIGLKVTGDYDGPTMLAVRWWQNNNGYRGGRGIRPDSRQLTKLLGDDYTVVTE